MLPLFNGADIGLEEEIKELFRNSAELQPFEKKIWLFSPTMHGEEIG